MLYKTLSGSVYHVDFIHLNFSDASMDCVDKEAISMKTIESAILPLYFIALNLLAFTLMILDKGRARSRKRRVPERVLLAAALAGGALGAFLAMHLARHKTKHPKFRFGLPFLLALWLLLFLYVQWTP